MIYIDFETRSAVDLKKSGAWKYAEDKTTDVLCLGYAINESSVKLWTPGQEIPIDLQTALDNNHLVEAHNAFFERAIWRNIMVRRYGWDDIKDERWRCSAAKSAAHALPRSLDQAAQSLSLTKQKDLAGKRLMLKLSKPRTATKFNKAKWHTKSADFKILLEYCKNDVETERELHRQVRDLSEFEQRIWFLDQKINERGILVDVKAVKAAMYMIDKYTEDLEAELKKITKGKVTSATQRDRLLEWITSHEINMLSLTKQEVTKQLENKKIPTYIRRILEIRQELSKTSTAKYKAILQAICADGRLRDLLMYHGASTGRWSGKLVQPQNFPRNTLKNPEDCVDLLKKKDYETFTFCFPNVMETLSTIIRSMLIATPGSTMYGGDYSAIEARVLFWLAGEKRGTEMFRKGEDIYVDLARTIYKTQDIDTEKRALGKRGILGCGYGMGAKKFKDTCKDFANVDIESDLAETVVETYRSKYYSVVRFWRNQEAAAIQAVKTGKVVRSDNIIWGVVCNFLYCKLPSSRCLAYYSPKLQIVETPWKERKVALSYMNTNSMTRKWERSHTYGGKLVENITQAVARDIMAEAMLRCEAAGYKVLLSVHDELITEKERGDIQEFERLMAQPPMWAINLPIKAEGWQGERYKK